MADNDNTNQLYVAEIDKALQKPSMFLYVPVIKVFLPEVFIFMGLFAIMKFWVVVFLPLHLILIMKTNENIFWVDDMIANFMDITLSSNMGIKGKRVITHQPYYMKSTRKEKKSRESL